MKILRKKEHRRLLLEWWPIPVIYGLLLWFGTATYGWLATLSVIVMVLMGVAIVFFGMVQLPKITRAWVDRGED